MYYALKGKEGEKMRVKKSNMNILIMRVYHKKVKNLGTMNILVTNVKDVCRYIEFNSIDLIYQTFLRKCLDNR